MEYNVKFDKLAEKFNVFSVFTLRDIMELRKMKDDASLFESMKGAFLKDKLTLEEVTKLEILFNLLKFCLSESFDDREICAIFSIYWQTLEKEFSQLTSDDLFASFKRDLFKHAVDRPPIQMLILSKDSVEKVGNYFVDTFYRNFELIKYLVISETKLELRTFPIFEVNLPQSGSLSLAKEILPRKNKILNQYLKNTDHLTELEKKIEEVLEIERDEIDDFLDKEFEKQDADFMEKVKDLEGKKKKR